MLLGMRCMLIASPSVVTSSIYLRISVGGGVEVVLADPVGRRSVRREEMPGIPGCFRSEGPGPPIGEDSAFTVFELVQPVDGIYRLNCVAERDAFVFLDVEGGMSGISRDWCSRQDDVRTRRGDGECWSVEWKWRGAGSGCRLVVKRVRTGSRRSNRK